MNAFAQRLVLTQRQNWLVVVLCLPSRNLFISYCDCLQKGGSTMEVGYLDAFSKIWNQSLIEWNERGPTKTFLTDFIDEISSYGFISTKDILICLFLGVAFTILRYILTAAFFKVRIFRNFDTVFLFFSHRVGFIERFLAWPSITIVLTKLLMLKVNIYNPIDCAPDISFI